MIPLAKGNLVENQDDATARLGTAKQPIPSPTQTPCERSNCQYSTHSPCSMVPTTINAEPVRSNSRKCPLSNRGPENKPRNTIKKLCTDPIVDIWNVLCDGPRVSANRAAWESPPGGITYSLTQDRVFIKGLVRSITGYNT